MHVERGSSEEHSDQAEPEGCGRQTEEPQTEKSTVAPAWPIYNTNRAKAELLALEMLAAGASRMRVGIATGLAKEEVVRLAGIAADEARRSQAPRNVMRTPRPSQRNRIMALRVSARLRSLTPHGLPPQLRPPVQNPPDEPEQMTLPLD
ncbi:hypothetical protein ACH4TS_20430 [Streptomyces albidoflavus]